MSISPNRPSPLDFLAPRSVDELLARPGEGLDPNIESLILPPTELDEFDRIGISDGRFRLSDRDGEGAIEAPNSVATLDETETDTDDREDETAEEGSPGNELVELAAARCSNNGSSGRPDPVDCVGEGAKPCGDDGSESRSGKSELVGRSPSRGFVSTRSASLASSLSSPRPRPSPWTP